MELKDKLLSKEYDYLAPDGSEIRLLLTSERGEMAHCVLPPFSTSSAVAHKSVEEIWFVVSGKGNLWRRYEGQEINIDIKKGSCINIPVGTHFQFKNESEQPLEIVIATMPKWPGKEEAYPVEGVW